MLHNKVRCGSFLAFGCDSSLLETLKVWVEEFAED